MAFSPSGYVSGDFFDTELTQWGLPLEEIAQGVFLSLVTPRVNMWINGELCIRPSRSAEPLNGSPAPQSSGAGLHWAQSSGAGLHWAQSSGAGLPAQNSNAAQSHIPDATAVGVFRSEMK